MANNSYLDRVQFCIVAKSLKTTLLFGAFMSSYNDMPCLNSENEKRNFNLAMCWVIENRKLLSFLLPILKTCMHTVTHSCIVLTELYMNNQNSLFSSYKKQSENVQPEHF